jgi:hypothetical protein
MFLVPTFLRRKCQQIREHGEHKTAHGETTRRSRVIYLFLFGKSCVFVLFFLSKAQLWFVLMFVLINKWVIHSCLARLPRMDEVSEPFSNPPKRHQGTEQSEPATRVVVSSLWFTKIALHHPSSAMDVTTSAAELRAATRERHALRCRPDRRIRATHAVPACCAMPKSLSLPRLPAWCASSNRTPPPEKMTLDGAPSYWQSSHEKLVLNSVFIEYKSNLNSTAHRRITAAASQSHPYRLEIEAP